MPPTLAIAFGRMPSVFAASGAMHMGATSGSGDGTSGVPPVSRFQAASPLPHDTNAGAAGSSMTTGSNSSVSSSSTGHGSSSNSSSISCGVHSSPMSPYNPFKSRTLAGLTASSTHPLVASSGTQAMQGPSPLIPAASTADPTQTAGITFGAATATTAQATAQQAPSVTQQPAQQGQLLCSAPSVPEPVKACKSCNEERTLHEFEGLLHGTVAHQVCAACINQMMAKGGPLLCSLCGQPVQSRIRMSERSLSTGAWRQDASMA